MRNTNKLFTKLGENIDQNTESIYPRPQLKRASFFSLDGVWEFGVGKEIVYDRKIRVPFCPESLLSGIGEVFSEDKTLYYKKEFTLPEGFNIGRVLLHFGAVDQVCSVFLNDKFIGEHIGGYDTFTFDITDSLKKENILTLEVKDILSDKTMPYGKQSKTPKGMWYTPVSGIWQSVWCESVPETYIKSLKISTSLNSAVIDVCGITDGKITVFDDENIVAYLIDGKAVINLKNPKLWTPETPYLYKFIIEAGEDKVESYFALRTLSIGKVGDKNRLLLNGKPYFFHGVLDQGYFSDGIFTPASLIEYTNDILKMKNLGFNMLRKHIKVEPEFFYSECDRLGMVVFQDMVNNGIYSFFKDTLLPTIGVLKRNDKNTHNNPQSREMFIDTMKKTVNQLYNHPCICQWTIFNEGWGQFCADSMYNKLKALDDTRFIDSASGWFYSKKNDFNSRHIYFRKLKVKCSNKPLFISEFGGYSLNIKDHVFNSNSTYGYGNFKNREDFAKAFRNLYLNEVLPLVEKGLCATVYTQLSDVEDETNGLVTYDRKVMKIFESEFADIYKKLQENLLK